MQELLLGQTPWCQICGQAFDHGQLTRIDGLIYIRTTRWMSSPDPTRWVHCGGGDSLSHHSIIPRWYDPWHFSRRAWKAEYKSANRRQKYSIHKQLATYLSLVVWEELRRFLAADRVPLGCPVWVSALGVGLRSLSLLPPASSSSAQSNLFISIVCMKSHMNILRLG